MSNHTSIALVLSLSIVTACASSPREATPDAPPPPLDPVGTYAIRSIYSLAAAPALATPVLAELIAATDGPDDPSRYLIDKLVARVPDGRVQLVAAAVAPYLAAYVQARIDTFAPRLAIGVRALGDGLGQIARHFGTNETLTIGEDGRARRLITGLYFEPRTNAVDAVPVDVPLAPLGVADVSTSGNYALAADHLTIGENTAMLPYGALLRAGLERAVIPRVVPGAGSLDAALVALVDCSKLGGLVADYVGAGTRELYARACDAALTHLASVIEMRLAVADAQMSVAGSAHVIDLDGDGPTDVIASGTWAGTIGDAPVASSVFAGAAP